MHAAAFDFVHVAATIINPGKVLEVGSRVVNGSVRELFPGCEYTGIDVLPGPGVDHVANVLDWKGEYECIVCCEVLEHCQDPDAIVTACHRLLKDNGWLVLTCAGPDREPHGIDGGDVGAEHYRGLSVEEVQGMLHVFRRGTTVRRGSDVYAVAMK